MGPGIYVPLVLVAIVVPTVFAWARKRFKESPTDGDGVSSAPSVRLTSNALRGLAAPPWRVVYEIAGDKLGGVEHVVIGPAGIYAVQTSMDPPPPPAAADAHAIGRMAIVRGPLDDVLRRCSMTSTALVTVHWGVDPAHPDAPSIDVLPGALAVDGRRIADWAAGLPATALSPAQVDLAWQTVVTSIGRPDPLA